MFLCAAPIAAPLAHDAVVCSSISAQSGVRVSGHGRMASADGLRASLSRGPPAVFSDSDTDGTNRRAEL